MTTLHVATDGDDSKDGSASSPLRTISRAADLARPGDTVLVHGGEYREWVQPRVRPGRDGRWTRHRRIPVAAANVQKDAAARRAGPQSARAAAQTAPSRSRRAGYRLRISAAASSTAPISRERARASCVAVETSESADCTPDDLSLIRSSRRLPSASPALSS